MPENNTKDSHTLSDDRMIPISIAHLAGECKVLKELQSKTDDTLKGLNSQTTKVIRDIAVLQEHFKAYRATIRDILTSASALRVEVIKVASTLQSLQSEVCSIDGRKEDCLKRFQAATDETEEVEKITNRLMDEVRTLVAKIDTMETDVKIVRRLSAKLHTFQLAFKILKYCGTVIVTIVTFMAAYLTTIEMIRKATP